ncbi:hypothetical protein GOZ97_07290 [Agrobacterium vitis]|uniref:hypothetical protein n=1 Tax=Rhizobium/Agrobacterium group TaxID=227290 RepID=UPI0008DC1046|nr:MULTISPECIES: hypothetical protein [Rhizobium/Agrobacterium group]MCF1435173.1 hypothetical protein [Allorhizobium ampelinum]MUO92021.1 hypothetical protein [Agrobacterium vitis]MUZ53003.1 hypothetical protein [Agrobacterium vitis]MUZ91222.1 hypothetical protein [Agrobacterium vitis]MVA40334.1 hypothetical protein [Agrobacterium vitis]
MSDAEKIIVVQFKKNRAGIVPGDMRQASSVASAEKIAGAMAARYIGVAAYAITIDEENGNMTNPRLLVSQGQISDLIPD